MTHWFHRNPLKATAPVSFNYYGVVTGPGASSNLQVSVSQSPQILIEPLRVQGPFIGREYAEVCNTLSLTLDLLLFSLEVLSDNLQMMCGELSHRLFKLGPKF